mmetsp:Transcript_23831/g.37274  ORF Transcript_23831/g.37274 Transcript_23831/m.37274 type:complete len:95 (+) Transcript_23831:360-644(+)
MSPTPRSRPALGLGVVGIQGLKSWFRVLGFYGLKSWSRVQGLGLQGLKSWFRVEVTGFRDYSSGITVRDYGWESWFRVLGSGLGVRGFECKIVV